MSLRLDVYLHLDEVLHDHRLDQILTIVKQIQTNTEKIMASLDETLAAVTAEDTKVDSIIALLAGLKAQLADVLSGTVVPPAVQAKIDQIFSQATNSAGKIDAAIAANTPPTP